ncbi:MAG: hypothetical protein U0794_21160 [Isosphaeraceae bacterium]
MTVVSTPYVSGRRRSRPKERLPLTQLAVAYALWPAAIALRPFAPTLRAAARVTTPEEQARPIEPAA